jgi:hypothetical protein
MRLHAMGVGYSDHKNAICGKFAEKNTLRLIFVLVMFYIDMMPPTW